MPHGLSQVDVIVSDCMGDCVLGQGDQMEQVIEARNRFLKPSGKFDKLISKMLILFFSKICSFLLKYETNKYAVIVLTLVLT